MIFVSASSCSKYVGIDASDITPKYLFFKPYINWGSSKSQITSLMNDCNILFDSDNTVCYQSNNEIIAYAFKNDKLHTIVVIPEITLSLHGTNDLVVPCSHLSWRALFITVFAVFISDETVMSEADFVCLVVFFVAVWLVLLISI